MRTNTLVEKRSFLFLSISLCLAVGFAIAVFDSPLYIIAALLYLLMSIVLFLNRNWALSALLLASFSTAIYFDVGPVTIRPDQIVTMTIAPPLILMLISGFRPVVTTKLDWLIIAYLFCNCFSSLLNSPDRAMSFQKCVLLAITLLAYFVTTQLIQSRKTLNKIIQLFIVVGVLEAMYGIVSVILYKQGIDIGGAHAPYGDLYARGTFLEGNIFGSFQMIVALMLISFLFSRHFIESRGLILLSLFVVLLAMMLSYTRAAWIGFLIGCLAYLIVIRRQMTQAILNHLPSILVAIVLIVTIVYAALTIPKVRSIQIVDLYVDRFINILEYRSGTGSLRVRVWTGSFQLWKRNPIFGNGTDSIKVLGTGTSIPMFGTEYWIPNSILMALHDTGLIGFLLFSGIQIVFLWNLRVAMRRTRDPYQEAVLRGFFVAFVGVLFTYLFTNAFWLIFIWVFMGIGVSCARIALKPALPSAGN